ncbi:uncharacterized protein L203_104240 [Cryptococcus depauperatus CBS 7841]|uniref:Uncharacterized protein n=1 Tax=Cryptococcus depauperatus CBS 7841 TaxID=1295531 RepID=A0A1E3I646_9TREE|nr:hypothetical protein L203_05245 [Cryptococcus depauperatus CBS 7841]
MPSISSPGEDEQLLGALNGSLRPSIPGNMADKQARTETFQKVKPICVSLMALASDNPTPYSEHHKLIDQLYSLVASVPAHTLDPAMINYVLFPLTTTMRQSNPAALPDNFLEAAFNFLAFMVRMWRLAEGGMSLAAWEQLWKFGVSAVEPRVISEKGKGKGKEIGQEVLVHAVSFLTALLAPSTGPGSDKAEHPSPAMLSRVATPKSPMLPTLFQTITILLESSFPNPSYSELQLSSLKLLQPLINLYLRNMHPVLAAVLPGTVSKMTRLISSEGKNLKGEIASKASHIIEDVVTLTLNDQDLQQIGVLKKQAEDLSQLADWEASNSVSPGVLPTVSIDNTSPAQLDPFPPLSISYLSFTAIQLLSTISPVLFTLVAHPSDLARCAAISLSHSFITQCSASLPLLVPRALTCLLLLSQDTFDPVRHDARRQLRHVLANESLLLSPVLIDILNDAINSLPRLVTSQQDTKVDELVRLVTAIAEISTESSRAQLYKETDRRNVIAELLGPNGNVERWSWTLLECLELKRPTSFTASAATPERAARLGWEGGLSSTSGMAAKLLQSGSGDAESDGLGQYPHLSLRYVESETTKKRIETMLSALGSAGEENSLYSVEHFVLFAKANRHKNVAKAVSALWVAENLLEGVMVTQVEGVEGKVGRKTRKMAREMAKVAVSIDEDEEEDEEEITCGPQDDEALLPIERKKGVDTITTLLDRRPLPNSYTSAETFRLHTQTQRILLTALSLQSFSLSAQILSSSFRPLLLSTLYMILSHLASPQPIIQSYASLTLEHVAHHAGYTSPSALVLDNIDYVVNTVTQRLTYQRLSTTAPLVLIAMIRLVGDAILPLVQEVVDEVFDALDDYHGYETMASSLLAVLVTLIEVMSKEAEAEEPDEHRLRKQQEMSRIEKAPRPEEDFAEFDKWWNERANRRGQEVKEILERAPQHAWGSENIRKNESNGENDDDLRMEDVEEEPPSRSQQVTTRILSKSIYFLTHRSPFLRSKILSLIARAIPVLALGNRESELLPLIHDSWNLILNRLDDTEPYVVVEAAQVVANMCLYVGDFMSKRVLDHAWPKLLKLIVTQQELDKKSALTRRGPVGTDSAFTVSHRLHMAILQTATFIARQVPVANAVLWEMMLSFRPFLDQRVHEELQEEAMRLYKELGERDGDALWIVLEGTLGNQDLEETWGYLQDRRLNLEENIKKLMTDL